MCSLNAGKSETTQNNKPECTVVKYISEEKSERFYDYFSRAF